VILKKIWIQIFFILLSFPVLATPESFVLQGQIIKPSGEFLEEPSVDFNVKIYSPDPNRCLLYEENFNGVNMSTSVGNFKLTVGGPQLYAKFYRSKTPKTDF